MRFKVGDKVIIRSDVYWKGYEGWPGISISTFLIGIPAFSLFKTSKKDYIGRTMVIRSCTQWDKIEGYKLEHCPYMWADEMLQPSHLEEMSLP